MGGAGSTTDADDTEAVTEGQEAAEEPGTDGSGETEGAVADGTETPEEVVPDEAENETPEAVPEEAAEAEEEQAVEEEQPEEQEATAMPQGTKSCRTAGGIFVTATFGENVFPEGVMMQATDLSKEEAMNAAAGAVEGEVVDAAGADITFYDATGNEVEPYEGGEVQVSLTLDTPLEDGELAVVHIDDAGNAEELAGSDVDEATENGASFTATEFSIYVEASFTKDDSSGNSVANVEYDYEGHKLTFDLVLDGSATITYDGTPKKPSVQNLALDGRTAAGGSSVKATDVSYENNTDAGKATIIFAVTTGKLKWFYVHANFTIEQLDLNDAKVDVSNCIYDGTEQKPEVTVTYNGKHISADNYNVEYTNSKNLGEGSTTITGKNNCTGTVTKTFLISKVRLSKCSMSLSKYTYYMDEDSKEPVVTVKYGNETLKEGEGGDYKVEYRDNDKIGTADVVISATASSNYEGSCVMRYYIKARPIKTAEISLQYNSVTYDGSAQKPTVTVTMEIDGATKTLVANTDYTVTYSNNVDVGTATVTVKGIGNYSGEVSETFAITPKSISDATVTLSQDLYKYDGLEKKPVTTVKDGEKTLREDVDYTVTYKDNIKVGGATATITGKGNYDEKTIKTKTFEITKASISDSTVTLDKYTYTDKDVLPVKPKVTVTLNGKDVDPNEYTVNYNDNDKVGLATVTVMGNGNNCEGKKEVKFQIMASDYIVTLDQYSYDYTGSEIKPEVTVKYENKTLTKGTDYEETYTSSEYIKPGEKTITVKGKGSEYSAIEEKVVHFTINKRNIEGATVVLGENNYTYAYDNGEAKEQKPTVSSVTVSIDDPSKKLELTPSDYDISYSNNVNAGKAEDANAPTVIVTGKSDGNYTGMATATFTINPAPFVENNTDHYDFYFGSYSDKDVPLIDNSDNGKGLYGHYTYDGTKIEPDVTVFYASNRSDLMTSDGSSRRKLVKDKDYTVTYKDNEKIGTAFAIIQGTGNYYSEEVKCPFTIEGKDLGTTDIELSPESYIYDGEAKSPKITVKDGETTLKEGEDYKVAKDLLTDKTDVGKVGVVITGVDDGNYAHGNVAYFTIEPLKLSDSATKIELEKTEYTRDYTKKKPAVTVTYNGKTIDSDNYKVTYENNIYGPEAKVTVTGTSANCIGTRELSFTIYDSDISNADITVSPDTYTYDGKAKEPEVTVTLAGKTLKANDDYTVEYSDNVDVGTATVTVTGVGEYEGTQEATFTIAKKSNTGGGGSSSSGNSSSSSSSSGSSGSSAASSSGGSGSSGSSDSSSDKSYTAGSKGSKADYVKTGKKAVRYDMCEVGNKKKTATVPSEVKISKKTYKVTAVSSYAFVAYNNLESVTIAENVKKIGASAFSGCSKLKTITIKSRHLTAKGVKNCLKDSSVETIIVPDGTEKAYAKIFAKENSGRGKAVKIVPASKAAKKK